MSSTHPQSTTAPESGVSTSGSIYAATKAEVGYIPRSQATAETYAALGFKCGLEIHQQLNTTGKLFCRCPAGIYQKPDDFDAEVIRHMRPTLSELGEYDGTALMEFKTRKTIIYRIRNASACTYEIDDTPPFLIDESALKIALRVALILRMTVVGELHIARKQYLDGSIPTGFQRTGIVAIEGSFPIKHKTIRIIQLSIEEDSCREVSDVGHLRIYRTDRLGMPLIETVTYPDMLTPDEAAEAAQYLRTAARLSGQVRTGAGAAREDVNVSITGGTRVEIKGVASIRAIPELTHNEAYRQKSLLIIQRKLGKRGLTPETWKLTSKPLPESLDPTAKEIRAARISAHSIVVINLPGFAGLLAHFTQPEQTFSSELSDRLKVIAGLERPNLLHSEMGDLHGAAVKWREIAQLIGAGPDDAQILVWGPKEDVATAVETIGERCRLAMIGIPNETRKALTNGTTIFERVLPGPDRMYPDTDSAPIPIEPALLAQLESTLPQPAASQIRTLIGWETPESLYDCLLRRNLVPLIEELAQQFAQSPYQLSLLLGQYVRHLEARRGDKYRVPHDLIRSILSFLHDSKLNLEAAPLCFEFALDNPGRLLSLSSLSIPATTLSDSEIAALAKSLRCQFSRKGSGSSPDPEINWITGQIRPQTLGRVPMAHVRRIVAEAVKHG